MTAQISAANQTLSKDIAACGPALLAVATRLVGRQEAEDLVQATLEKGLLYADSFRPGSNLLAWLRRIMSNLVVDTWRRDNRRSTCVLVEDETPAEALCTELARNGSQPWEELTGADLRSAVAELPRLFRQVYELHAAGGAYAEIARQLNLPLGTVGTRLRRARQRLRILLTMKLAGRNEEERARPHTSSPAADDGCTRSSAPLGEELRTALGALHVPILVVLPGIRWPQHPPEHRIPR